MALERNSRPGKEESVKPTLLDAVESAMGLADTRENIVRTINGVTVTIPGYNPLSITYRFLNAGGDITSYTFTASIINGKEGLIRKYNQVLEHALSGDFPDTVSELLLEHADAIRWFSDHYEQPDRDLRR